MKAVEEEKMAFHCCIKNINSEEIDIVEIRSNLKQIPLKFINLKVYNSLLKIIENKLLEKCLYSYTWAVKTQNKLSLNGMIWKRCPKDSFVEKVTVEFAVASAVISFNNGTSGILAVVNQLKQYIYIYLSVIKLTQSGFK